MKVPTNIVIDLDTLVVVKTFTDSIKSLEFVDKHEHCNYRAYELDDWWKDYH